MTIIENKISKFTLEDRSDEFEFKQSKINLNIKFNRIAFIFFVFFLISIIYAIHLSHLGSRNLNHTKQVQITTIHLTHSKEQT